MAFEAGRGGSGLEPKTGRTSADPGGFRRTPPPDPPGPRTDPGRTRHRTIRTRRTGGAHLKGLVLSILHTAASVPVVPFCSRIGQMSSIAALEKRVKALEDDEDFAKPSYVPPPPPAASSAGASSSEVDALRKENAKLQDLLAKERYRIKHLIRAIEAKS